MIMEFIRKNGRLALEIAAGIAIIVLLYFSNSASEITKSTKSVVADIKTDGTTKIRTVDTTKTDVKKDGSKTITRTKVSDVTKQVKQTAKVEEEEKTVIVKKLSRYSLDIYQSVPTSNLNNYSNPENLHVLVGIRLLSLPIFMTIGTNAKFQEINAGLRIEF